MNKATMLPIHNKWLEMIFNGTKEYEFRGYPVEGKIYFYETKGKKVKCNFWTDCRCSECPNYTSKTRIIDGEGHMYLGCTTIDKNNDSHRYEGSGMVVGEAVVIVEESFKIKSPSMLSDFDDKVGGWIGTKDSGIKYIELDKKKLQKQGYTNQKYAMKLINIIKYDKPIPKEEFVLWNKVFCKDFGFIEIDCEKCNCHGMYRYGWEHYCTFKNKLEPDMCMGNDLELPLYCPKNTVQSAPQGKIFVVERE